MPTNATGVQVVLQAVDANGVVTTIGTVTSDSSGMYKLLWAPQNEGTYTIVATFAGSNSYYQSSAQTAIGVVSAASSAASPIVSPTSGTSPSAETSPSTAPPGNAAGTEYYIIAAAVVVGVVVAVIAVVLRKRK